MRRCILLFGIILSFHSYAQNHFNVVHIPDSLRENADAVIRYSNTNYEIKNNVLLKQVSFAITILNENAKERASLVIPYNSYTNIKSVAGVVYNSMGIKTNKLSKDDMADYAAYPSFTLFSDSRIKIARPVIKNYPITFEYIYEIEYSGFLMPESWMPILDYRISLEKGHLQILIPDTIILFRYQNIQPAFNIKKLNGKFLYTWDVDYIKAFEKEPFSKPFSMYMPKIFINIRNTGFYGHKVGYDNWESYGKMIYNLLIDRDKLPRETIEEISALCRNAENDLGKVNLVYSYMQNKVRYVNVTKGIGGYQPIAAADVNKYGYGDCKALANYTRALLQSVGIKSYYTEIGSGKDKTIAFTDFASIDQTNHAILCVPLTSDTMWLECTNSNMPLGYIGAANSNRKALLVAEEGGKLVNTPTYDEFANRNNVTGQIYIDTTGVVKLELILSYANELFDEIMPLMSLSKDEQEKYIIHSMPINGFNLRSYKFENKSTLNYPLGELEIKAEIPKYADLMGKRIAFKPNVINRYNFTLHKKRRTNFYISQSYTQKDSIIIHIPDGYRLEFEFQPVEFSCQVGSYNMMFTQIANHSFLMKRTLVLKRGEYSIDEYPAIYDFFRKIASYDNKNCVFNKYNRINKN